MDINPDHSSSARPGRGTKIGALIWFGLTVVLLLISLLLPHGIRAEASAPSHLHRAL